MKKWRNRFILLGTASWLAGCATGPNFKAPATPTSTTFENESSGGAAQRFSPGPDISAQWWELFHCEVLDDSVRTALTNSPTLAQALARLRQAQEEYNAQAGATKYPAVDAGFSASRQKVNPAAMGITGVPVPDPFSLYNASVSLSYALDLFGKNRRALEALQAQVDRRDFELEAVRQTLAANVVLASIRQAELTERLHVAQGVLAARSEQMAIAQERYKAGGISALELEHQGVLLEQARASLPVLENQSGQVRRQLGVYLGREPAEAPSDEMDLASLQLPEELPLSLPAEVAKQRPDIRAAEAVWHQACANVGVATANLYPQITLTGSLGSQKTDIGDILDKMNVWSLGGDLMQPIFHGGALRAQKRAAVAAYDEAAAAYRETVLRGLQEVADTLGALESDARTLDAQTTALGHAKASHEIAQRQKEAGGISQFALLDERIRHLQAEGDQMQAQAARHADAAALFHALGGGWWNRETAASAKDAK
jgi:NodT family efflux transporter outer membrane factor (OMF) lipoprotein